jgi:hypothetical protein
MPGPPAIDSGMNTCGNGLGSGSTRPVGESGTMPTIVSHISSASSPGALGGRFDAMRRPIGSWSGKYRFASALLTTATRSLRSTSDRSSARPRRIGITIASK